MIFQGSVLLVKVSGSALRISGSGCRVLYRFGVWVSGFGFGAISSGSWFPLFESRLSGFGLRVSSSRFRVPGLGFRVLGFRFRVSGSGFGVSGVGRTPPIGDPTRKSSPSLGPAVGYDCARIYPDPGTNPDPDGPALPGVPARLPVQGYLAHKKPPHPRTLQ